jgi:hypothetical protein
MDGVRAGLARSPDVLARIEVRTDLDDLVGDARVQRAAVVRRDDGDRRDPLLATGAEDAHGDLASIGHEQFLHDAED